MHTRYLPTIIHSAANVLGAAPDTPKEFVLIDLLRYFAWSFIEGDQLNDWLTHLPASMQDAALVIGTFLAQFGA